MSALWESVQAALQLRKDQHAAGASAEEIAAGFEKTIRSAWPFTREWQYLCDDCDDSGWKPYHCQGGERPFCGHRFAHHAHTYVEPCQCAAGIKHQPRARDDSQPAPRGRRR